MTDPGFADATYLEPLDFDGVGQVLVEESLLGWDEFELELMRDRKDNVVVVCSIENLDPMGVHTGDSVTVAPQMTLSDHAYQELRDAAAAVIRAIGVDTGGSNIQFARERETGELRVIEMNPRVSRSSALASKATGYPIAKVAAKLAVGYTLDEIPNDLTGTTPASFEPTLDYVVVKFPRFAFEKFAGPDSRLGDSCAGAVEAASHYLYSTWGEADDLPPPRAKPRVVILGSGPNRIGQGIEFDYCCVHAARSFRGLGNEAVMVNCNPETVSTDYDTSDRLYFEPLGLEEGLAVCEREQPEGGGIQFGGQSPPRLARGLEEGGGAVLG